MHPGAAIDLCVAGYLVVAGLVGLVRGAVRELFGALAIVLPVLVSIPAYFRVAVALSERTGMPLVVSSLASFLGIFLVIALACRAVAWAVERRLEKSEFFASFNRSLGAGIGMMKAGAISLACAVAYLLLPLPDAHAPAWVAEIRAGSRTLRFATYFVEPVAQTALGGGRRAELAREILADPKSVAKRLEGSDRFREFATSERVRRIFETPKMKAFLDSPEVKRMAERGDHFGLMRKMFGPEGRAALDDPALLKEGLPKLIEEFEAILLDTSEAALARPAAPAAPARPPLAPERPGRPRPGAGAKGAGGAK